MFRHLIVRAIACCLGTFFTSAAAQLFFLWAAELIAGGTLPFFNANTSALINTQSIGIFILFLAGAHALSVSGWVWAAGWVARRYVPRRTIALVIILLSTALLAFFATGAVLAYNIAGAWGKEGTELLTETLKGGGWGISQGMGLVAEARQWAIPIFIVGAAVSWLWLAVLLYWHRHYDLAALPADDPSQHLIS